MQMAHQYIMQLCSAMPLQVGIRRAGGLHDDFEVRCCAVLVLGSNGRQRGSNACSKLAFHRGLKERASTGQESITQVAQPTRAVPLNDILWEPSNSGTGRSECMSTHQSCGCGAKPAPSYQSSLFSGRMVGCSLCWPSRGRGTCQNRQRPV
jgi:hypothetical protein